MGKILGTARKDEPGAINFKDLPCTGRLLVDGLSPTNLHEISNIGFFETGIEINNYACSLWDFVRLLLSSTKEITKETRKCLVMMTAESALTHFRDALLAGPIVDSSFFRVAQHLKTPEIFQQQKTTEKKPTS